MSPAKATRPGFRQSLAASFTDSSKNDDPPLNLFHPIYHTYTYPVGTRIDVDRDWPIRLEEEDTEDLIDAFSEPPQFVERLAPISIHIGDQIVRGNNWTEVMIRVYRYSFRLFQAIGKFIDSTRPAGQRGNGRVPFMSLSIDPDTVHRLIEMDYESGEASYSNLIKQFGDGTLAPCLTTPFHAILPMLSDSEIRLCARISFLFYHRILKSYQQFLKKHGEDGLAVVPFWVPESAFHSRVESILREEFKAYCKKARLGKPHLVFLLDSDQAVQEQNDVLMKSWNLLEGRGGNNGKAPKNGSNGKAQRRNAKAGSSGVHPGVDGTSIVFRDRTFSEWSVYANPSVKKLLDRTIAKVDSNLNRQEIHYGWAHFESLDSMAFSAKSVSNFKQKLVNLIELGYVPLAPDFYVRGKLRGQLGYSDIEPKFVSVRDNSISADWEEESELFSRWQGVKASPKNGGAAIADSRTYQRLTPKGIIEEQGPQCWKYAWSLVRENCGRAVMGDIETGKGGMAEVLADMVHSKKADIRTRNLSDFLTEYTYVYWREHFIQQELSEADINIHEIANATLRADTRGSLSEVEAATAGAAAQAIYFALESFRSCGTRYENIDQRAFYQNVCMLTLAMCNAVYVYTYLGETKKARKMVDLIKSELIGFEGAYKRYKLRSLGVTKEMWSDAIKSEVEDSRKNIVARVASRVAASHLRPIGFTRDFSREDELEPTSVGHLWATEIENPNYRYENLYYCGVSEA